MTVVVLTLTFDGRDGLSRLSRDVASALATRDGASVRVLSLAGSPDQTVNGVRASGCGGLRARLAAYALTAAARRPTAIVTLHTHMLPLALPFLASGATLAHVMVGIESWRAMRPLEAAALRRARATMAISAYTRDRFLDANPQHTGPDIVVVHPAAPALPPPHRGPRHPAPGYALIVGRMAAAERYKGHDVLIDAWPHVCQRVAGARLVVAGEGDDRRRLESRVAGCGLAGAITFTGPVDDAALAALYADAAVFVLPSAREGFGYVYLEAMQAGRACIGARGAAAEIIDEGVTGLLVDPADAGEVGDAVARLLGDGDLARRLGEAGRARARERFAPSRFARDLAAALAPVWPC